MELAGKSAVVTGGTGALGGAVVSALLGAGAAVSVPFRRSGELERLRAEASRTADAPLSGEALDLTDEDAVLRYFERVAGARGGLDILVCAAGGFAGGQPVHETPWSVWQQQLDGNLKTAVLASRAAALQMAPRRRGAIVHVSSRPATQDGKNLAAYAASKRALLQLTEAMAAELVRFRRHRERDPAVGDRHAGEPGGDAEGRRVALGEARGDRARRALPRRSGRADRQRRARARLRTGVRRPATCRPAA